MNRTRLLLPTLLILLTMAGFGVAFFPKNQTNTSKVSVQAFPVQKAEVHLVSPTTPVRLFGVTRGTHTAMVSFTLGGRIEDRPWEIGDRVRIGESLARIDKKPYQNNLASLRGNLAEVETNLDQSRRDQRRSQKLFDRGAATEEELEKVETAHNGLVSKRSSLLAEIKELERLLEESTLYSPITGTITEAFKERGEYAGPGEPIYALSGEAAIEVEIEVPESMILDFSKDDSVQVDFPYLRRAGVEGKVTSIGTSTLGPGRLFPVLIAVQNFNGLIPGLTAEVVSSRPVASGTAVPVEALINPGGSQAWLYKVIDGKAEKIPVEVARFLGALVVVEGKLEEGDEVITAGHFRLMDGDLVTTSENGASREVQQ